MSLKKDLAKIGKRLIYSIFIFMFFVIGFQLGNIYQKHTIETGDTLMEWLNMEKDCREVILNKNIEYSCDERIQDYEKIQNYVRFEVILVFLISILDYFIDPENHFATKIKGWLKSINLE